MQKLAYLVNQLPPQVPISVTCGARYSKLIQIGTEGELCRVDVFCGRGGGGGDSMFWRAKS